MTTNNKAPNKFLNHIPNQFYKLIFVDFGDLLGIILYDFWSEAEFTTSLQL